MSGPFRVDERVGCIAVRDTRLEDPDHPGLDGELGDVVYFRLGVPEETRCPTCGQSTGAGWTITEEMRADARAVCDWLNESPPPVHHRN